jgi:hypothetical protein
VADDLSRKDPQFLAISSATLAWVTDIEASYCNDPHYTDIIQKVLVNPQAVPHYTVHWNSEVSGKDLH